MSNKPIIYIDMDGPICNVYSQQERYLQLHPDTERPQHTKGFFESIEPVSGSLFGIKVLKVKYDVYIITTILINSSYCYNEKRNWIEKYLGVDMLHRFITTSNKGLIKGDYLIDDNTTLRGQDKFEGELIHFGSQTFPNWQTIAHKLL